jgi:3-oxoacyl-[acyl-carrier-protein] synthase-1
MGIINGIPGSLYVNLVPAFRIRGAALGFSSACASSAHSLGEALDLIRDGRQKVVFVVGAEDCNKFNILPFAAIRALSPQEDPDLAPRAFDKRRDGFVGTGGASVLVVEEMEHAQQRAAPRIYAEVTGWGQASDGHNVLAPDPSGDGLARAMKLALADAKVGPGDVDYLNAHATATEFGDRAEIEAIKKAFPDGQRPLVSSTKSLTGHGLSLAGAMESAFCCIALHEKFTPISAKITELDPMCDGVPIVSRPIDKAPTVVLNNSSGFGGANVAIVLQRWTGSAAA